VSPNGVGIHVLCCRASEDWVASKVGWWYSLRGVDRERVLRGKSVQGDLFCYRFMVDRGLDRQVVEGEHMLLKAQN